MFYIKLEKEIIEEGVNFKQIKERIYKLKYKFIKLKKENVENGEMIILPNLEKYTYDKLSKYLKINGITKICISEDLMKNKCFVEFLKNNNAEILDGRWLFKHMSFDVVKYICNLKNERINYQEVSILSNDIDIHFEYISLFKVSSSEKLPL